jgi:predicted ester cyclase
MSEQENIKAAQAIYDALNSHDWSKDPYRSDDLLSEHPGMPGPLNLAQNKAYLQNNWTAFPDLKWEVLLTVAQGDYVVTHWKCSGTHTGPLQMPSGATIPPTGKKAVMMGSSTEQVKNGKVVHAWSFYDMASLFGQLGLLPPM